jgi:7-cyano-7-deazaguanine synthase
LGCDALITGICQEDNANYPDCTEDFRNLFQAMANTSLGTMSVEDPSEDRFQILAPLMFMSKAESVKMAYVIPGCWDALAYSHTSYDGKYPPVDMNHSNVLRAHGFEQAGYPDPLVIRAHREGLMELPATGNYDFAREAERFMDHGSN